MKFSDIYSMCLEMRDDLNISLQNVKAAESGYVRWNSWELAWSILQRINSIPVFRNAVLKVEVIVGAPTHINRLSIPTKITNDTFNRLSNEINRIVNIMDVIILYGMSENIDVEANEFSVKLPNKVSLLDFAEIIGGLQKILRNCSYLNLDGDEVQFKSVDTGSSWLVFVAISHAATSLLKRIGELVHIAYELKAERQKNKYLIEHVKQMSMGTDIMRSITAKFEEAFDATTSKLCESLQLNNQPSSPEDVANTQMYAKMMVDLLDKGIEVYASLKAPADIKQSFPSYEQSKLATDELHLLEGAYKELKNEKDESK